jgi:DUF4097 and DUF4098 domain-containing protein YvlB
MADLPTLQFKQGEARQGVQFTITQGGAALDVSSATLTLSVAPANTPGTPAFTKTDSDFTKTDAANGVITVNFSAANLATAGSYLADIKLQFSAADIRKTETFRITIEDAIT